MKEQRFPKRTIQVVLTIFVLCIATIVRLIGFNQVPPSLYWEEIALGYDAYSISQTARDYHGNFLPLVAFESFGDWKPSLYFYTIVPFIWLLGLTETAVRVPSLLSGLVIVLSAISITKTILSKEKNLDSWIESYLPWITGLIIAISPWAVHFSRSAWEVNLATALITVAMAIGISIRSTDSLKKLAIKSMLTACFLCLSAYAYHGTRLIAPLLGAGLAFYWISKYKVSSFSELINKTRWLLMPAVTGLLLLLPILVSLNSNVGTQRFAETSIFSELDIIVESNAAIEATGGGIGARILFHRYFFYGRELLTNYLDHFRVDFLFLSGDSNPRHSSGYGGLLYYQEALLVLIGVLYGFRKRPRESTLLLAWWLLSIVPAAMTKATPHALRILPAMPAILIFTGFGFISFAKLAGQYTAAMLPKKATWLLVTLGLAALYVISFTFWWRHYYFVYPLAQAHEWQYGSSQMVEAVNKLSNQHKELPIYITREQGRPSVYYWFYSQTDPKLVQAAEKKSEKDQSEFLEFESITFPNSTAEVTATQAVVASSPKGTLLSEELGYSIFDLQEITNPAGDVVWNIYRVEK